jgi:hypothetical protein
MNTYHEHIPVLPHDLLKRRALHYIHVCIDILFYVIKPTGCTNFSNLFWNEILHVSDISSVHHQEFLTVHTAMIYVIQVCWQPASRIRIILCCVLIFLAGCQQTCMTYNIVVCTVKNSWWWTEKLSETCRIPFQNKFEKLVHLVFFIMRNRYTPSHFTPLILLHRYHIRSFVQRFLLFPFYYTVDFNLLSPEFYI